MIKLPNILKDNLSRQVAKDIQKKFNAKGSSCLQRESDSGNGGK